MTLADTDRPVKQTERPHPLTPFIRGWLVFVAIVLGFGRELIPDGDSDGGLADLGLRWILLGVTAIVVLAAAAGYVSWRFTRFVIDDDELRVETGVLFKSSRKIAFERLQSVDVIQPLAARMFGLAELRLEAGAGDSTVRLRYLNRAKASGLRDYLLTRAAGTRASMSGLAGGPVASLLTDRGVDDRPLVTVTPQRLVGAFLLSTEFLFSLLALLVVLVVTTVFDVTYVALGGLVPMVIGTVSLAGRRVVAMFHFTLAESARGLRITRGLTNLTSQSVPVGRIQGVKLSQSVLWRAAGWWRVDVDIVGYGSGDSENNSSGATSVLLPVADAGQVALALSRVLPGFEVDQVQVQPPPRRARWVRWFDFWTLRSGWDDRALVTQHGWMVRERHIVPHAKTQSVRIEQGPLQRRLRLADVHIDTPKGPVHAVARQLDAGTARELALGQLDRARRARLADREHRTAADVRPETPDAGAQAGLVAKQLQHLHDLWRAAPLGLALIPAADQQLAGGSLSAWLPTADPGQRRTALLSLLDRAEDISRLPLVVPGFARLVGADAPCSYGSLTELLHATLAGPTGRSRAQLERDLPDVARVWERLQHDLAERIVTPTVVHGNLRPGTVHISVDDAGPRVSGVGGFSPRTLQADPLMDLTGAVAFLELDRYPDAAADSAWLLGAAVERHGPEIAHWIGVYRRYFGFFLSDTSTSDPATYAWCLRQLDAGDGWA